MTWAMPMWRLTRLLRGKAPPTLYNFIVAGLDPAIFFSEFKKMPASSAGMMRIREERCNLRSGCSADQGGIDKAHDLFLPLMEL